MNELPEAERQRPVPIRQAVADFLAAGPLPDEDQSVEAIQRSQDLLERIEAPVTDEEAAALVGGFGPDDCYGLAVGRQWWNAVRFSTPCSLIGPGCR